MGIRIKESPSGKEIVGSANGQILVWNNTTKRWDVGAAPGGGAFVRSTVNSNSLGSGVITLDTTLDDGTTPFTKLSLSGWLQFQAAIDEAAGFIRGNVNVEVSVDNGVTFLPALSVLHYFSAYPINSPEAFCSIPIALTLEGLVPTGPVIVRIVADDSSDRQVSLTVYPTAVFLP